MQHPLEQFHHCPRCGSDAFEPRNAKAKQCGNCRFVYYFNPSAAVACFITDGKGRVLVAVRKNEPAKGTYDLPGGFADSFETAEEAAVREVYEETGLRVSEPRYLFSLPNIYLYSGFEVHTVDMFFELVVDDIEKAVAADDVSRLLVMEIQRLHGEDFGLRSVREAVEKYKCKIETYEKAKSDH